MTTNVARGPLAIELEVALCKALGLDPERVHSMTFEFKPGAAVTVDVAMYVDQYTAATLAYRMRRFRLVPDGPRRGTAPTRVIYDESDQEGPDGKDEKGERGA